MAGRREGSSAARYHHGEGAAVRPRSRRRRFLCPSSKELDVLPDGRRRRRGGLAGTVVEAALVAAPIDVVALLTDLQQPIAAPVVGNAVCRGRNRSRHRPRAARSPGLRSRHRSAQGPGGARAGLSGAEDSRPSLAGLACLAERALDPVVPPRSSGPPPVPAPPGPPHAAAACVPRRRRVPPAAPALGPDARRGTGLAGALTRASRRSTARRCRLTERESSEPQPRTRERLSRRAAMRSPVEPHGVVPSPWPPWRRPGSRAGSAISEDGRAPISTTMAVLGRSPGDPHGR
jgi:hypothetical protein